MVSTHEIDVEGHKLVTFKLNTNSTGIPVILLHGVTLSASVWKTDMFFGDYKDGPCYALSLPGHYPAILPPEFSKQMLTPEMFVKILTQAIQQLVGEQPVILVGHSTGGFAALALAAFNPDIAHGVVSLSGFAQGKWTGFYGLQQKIVSQGAIGHLLFKLSFQSSLIHSRIYRQCWRFVLFDTKAFFSFPKLDTLIEDVYQDTKHLDWDAMAHYFNMMPDIDITPMLSQITAPTLIVAGDKDSIVPPSQAHLITQHVPNSKLVIIKKVGHMLFVENPSKYTKILNNWFYYPTKLIRED
ncbi:alpha/beta hydrolase [Anaerolineales bacterium HSG24]|nr:alpha/beta hydrolase [Anaerolineales bacterium HSG24]